MRQPSKAIMIWQIIEIKRHKKVRTLWLIRLPIIVYSVFGYTNTLYRTSFSRYKLNIFYLVSVFSPSLTFFHRQDSEYVILRSHLDLCQKFLEWKWFVIACQKGKLTITFIFTVIKLYTKKLRFHLSKVILYIVIHTENSYVLLTLILISHQKWHTF